jgi:OmcA/MtrC family decaheme c-type cytochrome
MNRKPTARVMAALGLSLMFAACSGSNGSNGKSCTITPADGGGQQLVCPDGTSTLIAGTTPIPVNDAGATSCTIQTDDAGTKTLRCPDGTSVTLATSTPSPVDATVSADAPGSVDAGTATNDGLVLNVPAMTGDEWSALSLMGTVTGVKIPTTGAGTPIVSFKVTNQNGVPVAGLGQKGPDGFSGHFAFTIAKLVASITDPTTSAIVPSQWVNYEFVKMPTATAPQGSVVVTPDPETNGTLVDNEDGTYEYTFNLDVTQAATIAGGLSYKAPYALADLGALRYDPTATHRVVVLVGGAPTSSNVGALPVRNPATITYDFVPSGSAVTQTRDIVQLKACNACHTKLSLHAAYMPPVVDTNACVVCHTDQMKYGSTESFPATGTILTPGPAPDFAAFDPGNTTRIDGRAVPAFPNFIHKIHMGENLGLSGYDFLGAPFDTRFPHDINNCATCHVPGAAAPQANDWNTVPSLVACGSCHDTVNFTTGANHSLGGVQTDDTKCGVCHTPALITSNHIPVVPIDPSNAGLAGGTNTHTNASFIADNASNLPTGAIPITYKLISATVTPAGNPQWVFELLAKGTPFALNTYGATTPELIPSAVGKFVGSPTLEMAFAVPQDGILTPADYNGAVSINLKSLWRGSTAAGVALAAGSGVVLNSDGISYTATYTGATVPANAMMVTGGIGLNYGVVATSAITAATTPQLLAGLTDSLPITQTDLAAYPFNATTFQGGLAIPAPVQTVLVSGATYLTATQTARRQIVSTANCNSCHEQLGLFTNPAKQATFHAGQRNDANSCVFCHNTTGTDSGWSYNIKEVAHSIHSAGMRNTPFTWQSGSTEFLVGYPGIQNNCEACHLSGTYNFSAATSAAAVGNLLNTTLAAGTTAISTTGIVLTDPSKYSATATYISPFVTAGTIYGNNFTVNTGIAAKSVTWPFTGGTAISVPVGGTLEADPTTPVNSPIASACYACHDAADARNHMISNGAWLDVSRASIGTYAAGVATVAPINQEQCLVCHGSGALADIKAVHMNF